MPTRPSHKTLAAVQSAIVVVEVKSDIDPIPLLVVDQYAAALFQGHIVSLLSLFGQVVLFKLLLATHSGDSKMQQRSQF